MIDTCDDCGGRIIPCSSENCTDDYYCDICWEIIDNEISAEAEPILAQIYTLTDKLAELYPDGSLFFEMLSEIQDTAMNRIYPPIQTPA